MLNKGKKKVTVYTVVTNNYFPEMCAITLPTIEAYADKINADFQIISDRKFPSFPPTYEKLQIHELGKDNDWNIVIDADMLIKPSMPDLTRIQPDHVFAYMQYRADFAYTPDEYFLRDGRRLAICTNFFGASRLCHDVWEPLKITFEDAKRLIDRPHIVDEYCISRNVAKYGLKFMGIDKNDPPEHFLHLDGSVQTECEIVKKAKEYLSSF